MADALNVVFHCFPHWLGTVILIAVIPTGIVIDRQRERSSGRTGPL